LNKDVVLKTWVPQLKDGMLISQQRTIKGK